MKVIDDQVQDQHGQDEDQEIGYIHPERSVADQLQFVEDTKVVDSQS